MTNLRLMIFVAVAGILGFLDVSTSQADNAVKWRHPISLAVSPDGDFLFVANQRSGSLSVVDLQHGKVAAEHSLGESLVDLQFSTDGRLLILDNKKHELLFCRTVREKVEVLHRLTVSKYPVDLEITSDGARCAVSSLWSRRISFVASPLSGEPTVERVLDMPFAPRRQLLLEGSKRLLVGDAFGGKLAVVHWPSLELQGVRDFPGHNIRGLATSPSGQMLLVSHQMLNELAHTVRSDVHWGLLMSNDLRWLRMDAVLDLDEKIYKGSHMHPLGEAGSATGDPDGLAISSDGVVVVALSGVGEVAIGKERDFSLARLKVGERPTAVVIDEASQRAFVANTFSDSISVVDLAKKEVRSSISLGATPPLTLREKGERLFFSARLSHDSWMSCHSCHTDGHTNGMLNDNLSDATFGAPKRVLSLMGKVNTEPLAWTASAADFKTQVRNSIVKTMQKDEPPTAAQVDAIVEFVQSLPPPPPIDKARGVFDGPAVARGEKLFATLQCNRCHAAPHYTTPKTYDVGLRDQLGRKRFNPPSLVGVGQRGPYFHDNRAKSLSDVFEVHGHQLEGKSLQEEQLQDLLAFLRSL